MKLGVGGLVEDLQHMEVVSLSPAAFDTHTNTHTHTHAHTHTHLHKPAQTQTCTHIRKGTHTCMDNHRDTHTHTHTHTHAHAYTHIHTNTQTPVYLPSILRLPPTPHKHTGIMGQMTWSRQNEP